jgi:Sulfotransferase family
VRSHLSEYNIADEDSAPIVIGGIGGSGTRLVTQILKQEGVLFTGDMNEELDNLWFSLLFVRRSIVLKPPEEIKRLIWLFINAMRKGLLIPDELVPLLDEAARYDRGPALRKSVLEAARQSISESRKDQSMYHFWGWKQPNTHVLVPLLAHCLPQMKYIYVLRNGLDMAFSDNQNQLKYFWGDLLLDGDIDPSPRNSLRYWIASYKRICSDRVLLGRRLYILDFDSLCKNPIEQIQRLNEFLGLDVNADKLNAIARTIVVPSSVGRHQNHDCRQLCLEDINFVRNLGFDIKVPF